MFNERERAEIAEFRERYASAFEKAETASNEYEICADDYCDYMIYVLAKSYGIPPAEAGRCYETDYIKLVTFSNLEILRNEKRYCSRKEEVNNY